MMRRDVVIYGANPGSRSALEYILSVRCKFARVSSVDSLALLERTIDASPVFGCALIVAKREEVARLAHFMKVCGGAPTLQVVLGGDRHRLAEVGSPCTAHAHFDAMDTVLERLRVLCRRRRGPDLISGAAQRRQALCGATGERAA